MIKERFESLNKRLLDIIACQNQGIKRSRLQTLHEDLHSFDCEYTSLLRKIVQKEMEELA